MTAIVYKEIREIKTLKEIYNLLVQFNDSFPRYLSTRVDLSVYAAKLFEKAVVRAFFIENEIVGFIAFYCNDLNFNTAFLAQLAVVNCRKNSGIGSFLLDDCIIYCTEKKMDYIKCEVDNNNDNAISFYKKKGFFFSSIASDGSQFLIKKLENEVEKKGIDIQSNIGG